MQQGRTFSASGPGAYQPDCAFCQPEELNTYTLKETAAFRIVADHAPLIEGHILIIPKNHYTCYGDVPAEYDRELVELKDEVRRFFQQYYAPIVYWEHGIFHQTVFHAHLHCFPFGDIAYDPGEGIHELLIQNQEELRAWHSAHGQYFYLEDAQNAALFPATREAYSRVIQEVLGPGVVAHSQTPHWRSAQQRQDEGGPSIAAVKTRWQEFQQQEVKNAN